jgi:signal transduction histidine kinase
MTDPAATPDRQRIDWSQLWYPGPKREFTPAEMASAGGDPPNRTLSMGVVVNLLTLLVVLGVGAPAAQRLGLLVSATAFAAFASAIAWWLWWRPTRQALFRASIGVALAMGATAWLIRQWVPDREQRMWYAVVLAGGACMAIVLLWFLVVWRSQQIEGRLREQREREQAIESARRLAAAQIEPHFLFNTLASLQHWVATGDARAPKLLEALTGYLRATLPLFRRPTLPLADELLAVRHYLALMQLRLGDRLRFEIDVSDELGAEPLPPGLLLTLVENALQHGIEPQLAGGAIVLSARREAGRVVLEVRDSGPGPGSAPAAAGGGTGLANLRERLALAHPQAASTLELLAAPAGGAIARASWPAARRPPAASGANA